MAFATKANKIFRIMRYISNQKSANLYGMMGVKPSPIIGFGFATNFAMTFGSFPSKTTSFNPFSMIVRDFTASPKRAILASASCHMDVTSFRGFVDWLTTYWTRVFQRLLPSSSISIGICSLSTWTPFVLWATFRAKLEVPFSSLERFITVLAYQIPHTFRIPYSFGRCQEQTRRHFK